MTLNKDTLREEFMNNEEFVGTHGYCNEIFAKKIADWWLSKFDQREQEIVRLAEEESEKYNEWKLKAITGSTARLIYLSKQQALSDLISKMGNKEK